MKKANDPDNLPEDAEYLIGMGVRGKYADRYAPRPAHSRGQVHIQVWAPLVGFPWDGSEFRIADDTWLRPGPSYRGYEHTDFANFLSDDDKEDCRDIGHWLHIVQPVHHEISPKANVNAFLLALWIVRPTPTAPPLRFQEAASERSVARLLDRFQWVHGHVATDVQDTHLVEVSAILPSVRGVSATGRRLRSALAFTFRGCFANDRRAAYVCFAGAAEALLVDSESPEIGARLARAYGNLVAESASDREIARRHFKRLYDVRSAIMHGRADPDTEEGLHSLAEFTDAVRRVWRVILDSKQHQAALELDDDGRRAYFDSL